MTRVMIVASALAVRAGLRTLLNASPEDPFGPSGDRYSFEVVYEAASLAEVESPLPDADVLLLAGPSSDLESWTGWGEGRLALLLLTEEPDAAAALLDLPVRGWGILPLDCSPGELAAALRAVDEGLWVGSPALLAPLRRQLSLSAPASLDEEMQPLTEREAEVLELLARGLANKQIAYRLNISDNTVKFHVSAIYTKLGASNRTEAVRLGLQRGLVTL